MTGRDESGTGDVGRLRATWDRLGETDPYWAVLSDPDMRGGGWDAHLDAFLASGTTEVTALMARLAGLGLSPSGPALEFGCGVGRVTRALASAVGEAHGVDIAASMLARARERGDPGCTYHLNTTPDLSLFPDQRFGLVYSRLVFQHMPRALGEGFLGELLRVAAPDAPVVLQIPDVRRGVARVTGPAIQRVRRAMGRNRDTGGIEMHGIRRGRVEEIVDERGAEVIEVLADDSAGPGWTSWSYVLRSV